MQRFIVSSATAALITGLLVLPGAGLAAPGGQLPCADTALETEANSGVQGQARLCASAEGIRVDIDATNLTSRNAYTTWLAYFDRASDCVTDPCGPPDATSDNPLGVVTRLDSLVADDTGAAHFGGQIRGMRLSSGSAVRVEIFNHGVANQEDNRARARQLLTPQVPALGVPGMGVQADGKLGSSNALAVFDIP